MDHTDTITTDFVSSGDPVVDRRFGYAQDYAFRGDIEAAKELLQQSIEQAPHWAPLFFELGVLHLKTQTRDAAIAAFTDYLRCDPADRMGAAIKLALLGATPPPDHFGEEYVRALFDQYAPRFDSALVENLSYSVPQKIFALIDEARPASAQAERILDLGCGTGLAGERFVRRAACLDGVDLSPRMIAQAAAKKIYNRLEAADIAAYLQTPPAQPYDIVLAADVFVYVGALDELMPRIAAAMTPAGLFAFSVQSAGGEDFHLGADHRFAHSRPYIERVLTGAGLNLRAVATETLRCDRNEPIAGYIVLAEKPRGDLGTGLAMPHSGVKEHARS